MVCFFFFFNSASHHPLTVNLNHAKFEFLLSAASNWSTFSNHLPLKRKAYFYLIFVCLKCLPMLSEIQSFWIKNRSTTIEISWYEKSSWANGFLAITKLLSTNYCKVLKGKNKKQWIFIIWSKTQYICVQKQKGTIRV